MNFLEILQYSCLLTVVFLAMILLYARFTLNRTNKVYERSRYLMIVGFLILALHYAGQMCFGWRAQGEDVGALMNAVFYTIVITLFSFAMFNIQSGRTPRRVYWISGIGNAWIFINIGGGWMYYHSLHMGHILYISLVIYFIVNSILIYYLMVGFKKMRRTMDRDMGNPNNAIIHYMAIGTYVIGVIAAIIPLVIMFTSLLIIVAPIIFAAFSYFVVCFIGLGSNLSTVLEVLQPTHISESSTPTVDESPATDENKDASIGDECLSPEVIESIESSISKWIAEESYSDADVSIASLAKEFRMSRRTLSTYFNRQCGCTFRSWITGIRIDAAKRLIKENPQYSNEYVANVCGFSNRTYFQTLFKDRTGMTPMEWKKATEKN